MTWGYSVPQNLGFPVQEMVIVEFSYSFSLSEVLGLSTHSVSCTRKILNGLKVDGLVQIFPTVCFEDDSMAGTLLLLCWAIILEELLLFRISSLSILTSC